MYQLLKYLFKNYVMYLLPQELLFQICQELLLSDAFPGIVERETSFCRIVEEEEAEKEEGNVHGQDGQALQTAEDKDIHLYIPTQALLYATSSSVWQAARNHTMLHL